jgi:hypothetical protein
MKKHEQIDSQLRSEIFEKFITQLSDQCNTDEQYILSGISNSLLSDNKKDGMFNREIEEVWGHLVKELELYDEET